METKICSGCEQEKLIDEFAFKCKNKNIRHSRCRICIGKSCKQLYETTDRKSKIRARTKASIESNKIWIREYKENVGCKCGVKSYWMLDFHHRNQDKEKNISVLVRSASRKHLELEIKKCDVVCANCHRDIHHKLRCGSSVGRAQA